VGVAIIYLTNMHDMKREILMILVASKVAGISTAVCLPAA
jgi:hypothetical protein